MVDKVTQANKRIAKQTIKPSPIEPVKGPAGFATATARSGKSLWDTIGAWEYKNNKVWSDYLKSKGLPPIGSTGGEKSLELLNKGVNPSDKYVKLSDHIKELEKDLFKRGDKVGKIQLSKDLSQIQKNANKAFPKTGTSEEKLKFIMKEIAKKYPMILKKGMSFVRNLGFRMLGPITGIGYASDILTPSNIMGFKDNEEDIKMAGGGMMNMDEMIRPLGYEVGGVVPRSRQQSVMEEEAKPQGEMFGGLIDLIKNIRKNAFAPEQREDGGAKYMKMFDFLWGKGYSQPQIDAILSGKINQEDAVPARKNLDEEFKG